MDEFYEFIGGIPQEIFEKEEKRWENPPGYGVKQIKDFLDFRIAYIDKIMYNRYSESGKKLHDFLDSLGSMVRQKSIQNILFTAKIFFSA